ncbi:MAG: hypothetical protein JXA22_04485 [Candidatus Thermoplasmatota archaeon]|nr:hypothetical protein [Candidatus Thermoplasmatota archaeon]
MIELNYDERARTGENPLKRSSITHLEPQNNPNSGAHGSDARAFVRDIVASTHFLKTGNELGSGTPLDIRSFSDQKAQAVRISDYSFPTFVIRKPRQRSSYSEKGEGGMSSPSPGDHAHI